MVQYAIETFALNKIYNRGKKNEIRAISNVNLQIPQGQIYGLLGENGAGKTTTVSILTTMIKATSGMAKVMDYDVVNDSKIVRRYIGCLPQDAGLYEEFNCIENLYFTGKLRGIKNPELLEEIESLLNLVGLEHRKKDRVETFSGGMKRRLMIARSLLGKPSVLFLDEPTAGIDVLVSRNIRTLIKDLAKNRNITVLLSTHDMISAERICDRVGILHKGNIMAEGTPDEIITKYSNGSRDLEDAVVNIIGWTGSVEE